MSIAEVDRFTYAGIFADTVAFYLDKGFDLIAARILAADDMARSFICRDDVATREAELDRAEFIRDDMNMTGGEHEYWRFPMQTNIGKRS
jgi:hypothetical protein